MSLNLDARQRAMLQEMGVRVWARPLAHGLGRGLGGAASATVVASAVSTPAFAPGSAASRPNTIALPVRSAPPAREAADAKTAIPAVYRITNMPSATELAVGGLEWLFIGEPCTGDSARLLGNMLKALGLPLENQYPKVWVAQIARAAAQAASTPTDAADGIAPHDLLSQVASLSPRRIVIFGPHAASALLFAGQAETANTPFGGLRGVQHRVGGSPAVVTYHPSQLLRHPIAKAKTWQDLQFAVHNCNPD